jgi:UDP-3-O-acyl-N-acetylglucosamine deacetylase
LYALQIKVNSLNEINNQLCRWRVGHVIAERAGHATHTALVGRIMSDPSLYEILTFHQLATRVAHAR